MYQKLTAQERIAARFIPAGYTEYKRSGDSVIYASPDHRNAIAYRGKKARSEWYYQFTTENGFLSAITRFFESITDHDNRKKEKSEFITTLKPGDIMVMSWGYDQTNINFYQVIEVTGKCTIVIREIKGSRSEEIGFMTARVIPCPGAFVKDSMPMKKRVRP